MKNIEEADVALAQTNGNQLDNRRIRVEKAKVNRTLFLAKLPRPMSNNVQIYLQLSIQCNLFKIFYF